MLMKSKNRFKKLFQEKEKALMPYVCFGYPTIEKSKGIMEALLENGADALEIGFPFSDKDLDIFFSFRKSRSYYLLFQLHSLRLQLIYLEHLMKKNLT